MATAGRESDLNNTIEPGLRLLRQIPPPAFSRIWAATG